MPTQLLIILDDAGKLNVNGPIKNKLVSLGMLELAKEANCDYHKAQATGIQPASPADIATLTQGMEKN